ncbi:AKNA factor, partial [Halcyon senegalensis]|nr:AKNA factor [Halcyon senegalensis]
AVTSLRVPSRQDDYHKLLTKYAEAENTIDQLRLGARVSLYADPPQPSRSLAVGTVGTGCQVVALSIPRASAAAFSLAPATASPASPASPGGAPGPSDGGGSPQPPFPPPPGRGCPTCPGTCHCLGTQLTGTLARQTHKLRAQASPGGGGDEDPGWGWWGPGPELAGSDLTPLALQTFRKLKDAQDALERAYLAARQQHPEASGEFDPDRSVEGEIFRLGLCLEELKERLEPGARWQLPPQCPAHPALVEGPRGPVGDSKAKMGRLPRPLWQKQLRVEEDFGDLLQQYKHFKSLPESLSLERLSLAESGSQEEVDGPAGGDSGPSTVPHKTRSLEEGADLETSPLHTPERRPAPLTPEKTLWPGGTQGHLSSATTEESPAIAKDPPQVPRSRRSSGLGSAAIQHPQHKVSPLGTQVPICQHPQHPAGTSWVCSAPILLSLLRLQEQRIVSPETDSGFVGSEASRVSPPVHTPEHHPPGTGTPSSLGPSIPIPGTLHPLQKREVTPLPSESSPMGISPAGRQGGTGGSRLPPSTSWQGHSPPCWADSVGSEVAPDGDGSVFWGDGTRDTPTSHPPSVGSLCSRPPPAHTDSEVEGRSCASAGSHHPATAGVLDSPPLSPATPSPTLLSPNLPSLEPAHCDLLGSRLERDRAIRALQDEVWRLRRRLEESLRCSRSYPEGRATPRVTLARRVAGRSSSPKDAASSGDPSRLLRGRVAPGVAPARRGRSASLPRDRPDLGTSNTQVGAIPPSARGRGWPSPLWCPRLRSRWVSAGTRYQAGMPRAAPAPREEPGTPGCPQCHGSQAPSAGSWADDATRQPRHSTPRRTRCPTCRAPLGPPAPGGRDGATHGPGPGGTSSPGSRIGPRDEKLEQPGLWYLVASPGATAALGCLAPVPLVPYVPSVL